MKDKQNIKRIQCSEDDTVGEGKSNDTAVEASPQREHKQSRLSLLLSRQGHYE